MMYAESPAHLARETTTSVHQRLGVAEPLTLLQATWTNVIDRLKGLRQGLHSEDYLHSIPADRIKHRVLQVFASPSKPVINLVEDIPCPYCDHRSKTYTESQTHLTRVHKATKLYERYEILRDALKGLPQCARCLIKRSTWGGLTKHIMPGHCSAYHPHRTRQVPPGEHPDLREHAQKEACVALLEQPASTDGEGTLSSLLQTLHLRN